MSAYTENNKITDDNSSDRPPPTGLPTVTGKYMLEVVDGWVVAVYRVDNAAFVGVDEDDFRMTAALLFPKIQLTG